MSKPEQLFLKLNNWSEKESLEDYSQEECKINDRLILETHTNRQKLSPELQHYLNLRDQVPK